MIIVVLIVLLVVYFLRGSVLFSPQLLGVLSSNDLVQIEEAKQAIVKESYPADYSKMYSVIESNKGNGVKINNICKSFDDFDSVYCLKKASQQNPELRADICKSLEQELRREFTGKLSQEKLDKFVDGHEEDCKNGIPQFYY